MNRVVASPSLPPRPGPLLTSSSSSTPAPLLLGPRGRCDAPVLGRQGYESFNLVVNRIVKYEAFPLAQEVADLIDFIIKLPPGQGAPAARATAASVPLPLVSP